MTNSVAHESKNENVSASVAASRRIMAVSTGPNADLEFAFDVCMEELHDAHSRGDHSAARALAGIAKTLSWRKERERLRRAEARARHRMRCLVRPPRRVHRNARAAHRVGTARPSAKATSTGDPDGPAEPPGRHAALQLGGASW